MKILAGFAMLAIVLLALCSGCASAMKPVDANKWAADYYKQDPTFVAYQMTGVNKIEGTNITIIARSYRPPISVIPSEPSTATKLFGVLETGIKWFFGYRIMDRAFEQPRVVETRPEIVQPTVIQVPAAP